MSNEELRHITIDLCVFAIASVTMKSFMEDLINPVNLQGEFSCWGTAFIL